MKRYYFLLLTLSVIPAASFGQNAQVDFSNGNAQRISTNSVVGGPATGFTSPAPGGFYYALFSAAPSVTNVSGDLFSDPNWTFTSLYTTNTSSSGPGRLYGNDPNVVGWAMLPNSYPSYGYLSVTVIGWSGNIGTDIASVQAWLASPSVPGFFGQSGVGVNYWTGGPSAAPDHLFGSGPNQVQGFTLGLVPEPSAIALTTVGVAVCLWRRRRMTELTRRGK